MHYCPKTLLVDLLLFCNAGLPPALTELLFIMLFSFLFSSNRCVDSFSIFVHSLKPFSGMSLISPYGFLFPNFFPPFPLPLDQVVLFKALSEGEETDLFKLVSSQPSTHSTRAFTRFRSFLSLCMILLSFIFNLVFMGTDADCAGENGGILLNI